MLAAPVHKGAELALLTLGGLVGRRHGGGGACTPGSLPHLMQSDSPLSWCVAYYYAV